MEIMLVDYLKNTLSEFTEKVILKYDDGCVEVVFGATYDNAIKTKMCFKLTKYDDFIEIDDGGLTFQYLDKVLNLSEKDFIKNFKAIAVFYGVEIIGTEPKFSRIVKKVSVDSDILIELFTFRDCVTFLNTMRIFYI